MQGLQKAAEEPQGAAEEPVMEQNIAADQAPSQMLDEAPAEEERLNKATNHPSPAPPRRPPAPRATRPKVSQSGFSSPEIRVVFRICAPFDITSTFEGTTKASSAAQIGRAIERGMVGKFSDRVSKRSELKRTRVANPG